MDPQAGSSFIPKKPLAGESRSSFNGLLFSLALLAFLVSLGAAGGVFAYKQYLNTTITAKDESLKKTEAAFDPDAIETLVRTDRRIEEMRGLLAKHTAPSAIFTLLSQITLSSVKYDSFAYEVEQGGKATIEVQGVADSFSSVALQSDQFGASKYLSSVVFSDITITSSGKVDFTVNATVEPAALSFAKQVLEPAASEPAPEIPEEAAPSTTP